MNQQKPDINPFYSAKCAPSALKLMQVIRENFKQVAMALEEIGDVEQMTPEIIEEFKKQGVDFTGMKVGKRELALAITNLEQASMWAIKSISHYNVAKEE